MGGGQVGLLWEGGTGRITTGGRRLLPRCFRIASETEIKTMLSLVIYYTKEMRYVKRIDNLKYIYLRHLHPSEKMFWATT